MCSVEGISGLQAGEEVKGSSRSPRGWPPWPTTSLANLRQVPEEQAIPLLLLGLEQETFMARSLSCAGLGVKRNEAG